VTITLGQEPPESWELGGDAWCLRCEKKVDVVSLVTCDLCNAEVRRACARTAADEATICWDCLEKAEGPAV